MTRHNPSPTRKPTLAQALPWCRMICRLGLGAICLFAAHWCLTADWTLAMTVDRFGLPRRGPDPRLTALASLLAVAAIWLLAGIRSRVIALLAAITLAAVDPALALAAHPEMPDGVVLAALALALPVIFGGGGKWALYRRGWRDLH